MEIFILIICLVASIILYTTISVHHNKWLFIIPSLTTLMFVWAIVATCTTKPTETIECDILEYNNIQYVVHEKFDRENFRNINEKFSRRFNTNTDKIIVNYHGNQWRLGIYVCGLTYVYYEIKNDINK